MEAEKHQGDILVTCEGEGRIRSGTTVIMGKARGSTPNKKGVLSNGLVEVMMQGKTMIVFYMHSFRTIT